MNVIAAVALALALASEPGAAAACLDHLTSGELLAWPDQPRACAADRWEVARRLAARERSGALMARYRRASPEGRALLVLALSRQASSAEVARFMRRRFADRDEEVAYHALDYCARRCEPGALRRLSAAPFQVRAGCIPWAATVTQFGRCRYRPAAPFLVAMLEHACLNVVAEAEGSLRVLFPGAPAEFSSPAELQRYFRARLREGR